MKRVICLLLIVVLMAACVVGCDSKEDNEHMLPLVSLWYEQVMRNMDYYGFVVNYGEIITEEEFQELKKLHLTTRGVESSEICILHTMKDGTRELLILEPLDTAYEEFEIVDIRLLPKELGE